MRAALAVVVVTVLCWITQVDGQPLQLQYGTVFHGTLLSRAYAQFFVEVPEIYLQLPTFISVIGDVILYGSFQPNPNETSHQWTTFQPKDGIMVVPAQETVGTFYVAALNNGTSEVSYSLNVEAPLNIESLGQENLVGGASFNATIVEGQRRWTFVPKGFPAVLYLNIERCNADSPDLQLLVQVFGTDVGDFRPAPHAAVPCSATNDLNIVQAAQLSQEIFSLAACPARLLFQLDPPVYWAVLGTSGRVNGTGMTIFRTTVWQPQGGRDPMPYELTTENVGVEQDLYMTFDAPQFPNSTFEIVTSARLNASSAYRSALEQLRLMDSACFLEQNWNQVVYSYAHVLHLSGLDSALQLPDFFGHEEQLVPESRVNIHVRYLSGASYAYSSRMYQLTGQFEQHLKCTGGSNWPGAAITITVISVILLALALIAVVYMWYKHHHYRGEWQSL